MKPSPSHKRRASRDVDEDVDVGEPGAATAAENDHNNNTAAASSSSAAAASSTTPTSHDQSATAALPSSSSSSSSVHPPSKKQRTLAAELEAMIGSSSSSSSSSSAVAATSVAAAAAAATAVVVERKPLAATVYHHALHSIFRFLTLREFAITAVRVCQHWSSAAASLPPLQLAVGNCRITYAETDAMIRLPSLVNSRLRKQCKNLSLVAPAPLLPHMQYINEQIRHVQQLCLYATVEGPEGHSLKFFPYRLRVLHLHVYVMPPGNVGEMTSEILRSEQMSEIAPALAAIHTLQELRLCLYLYGSRAEVVNGNGRLPVTLPPFLSPLAGLPSLTTLDTPVYSHDSRVVCQLRDDDIIAVTTFPVLTCWSSALSEHQLKLLVKHASEEFRQRMEYICSDANVVLTQPAFDALCSFPNLRCVVPIPSTVRDYTRMGEWAQVEEVELTCNSDSDFDSLGDAISTMHSLHTIDVLHPLRDTFSLQQATRIFIAPPQNLRKANIDIDATTIVALRTAFPHIDFVRPPRY